MTFSRTRVRYFLQGAIFALFINLFFVAFLIFIRILVINPMFFYVSKYVVLEVMKVTGIDARVLPTPKYMAIYPQSGMTVYEIYGTVVDHSYPDQETIKVNLSTFSKRKYSVAVEIPLDPRLRPRISDGDVVVIGWEEAAFNKDLSVGKIFLLPANDLLEKKAKFIRPL